MSAPLGRAIAIFQDALDLDEADRGRLIDERCGDDDELRREVEGLLDLDSEQDPRLDESRLAERREGLAALILQDDAEPSVEPGDPRRIGEYTIVRRIGEGGMGIVYEATQEQPRRSVALKVLRQSAATGTHLSRFKHETEVLGLLKHPGIAQIYGAGSFDLGDGAQPYFAMELVDGETLLDWGSRTAPTVEARLELFNQLCDAIHYAHTRGIIHRDLKPDNILVTPDGQPKVLDFGVARATDSDLLLTTMHTHVGQLVGTVAYMSPEQAAGDASILDARSDIYTLGVILFELLSGRLPHEVGGRSIPDALRTILEDEPTKLRSIDTAYRGDLDTIVTRALDKDPARRYASAAELAGDIRRHLADEPIHARRPSTAYYAVKFARRHKGLSAGIALSMLSLAIGLAASLRFALGEAALRREADDRRAEANRLAYRMTMGSVSLSIDRGRIAESRELLATVDPEQRGWEWHHFLAKLDLHLWSAATVDAEVEHGWLRPEGSVWITDDGERVVAARSDRSLGVWSAATGALEREITTAGALAPHLLHTSATRVAAVVDHTDVVVFALADGREVERQRFDGPVSAVAWHPNGEELAVALDRTTDRPGSELLVGPPGALAPLATVGHVTLDLLWARNGAELLLIDDRLTEEATVNLTVTGLDAKSGAVRATYADSNPGYQVRSYILGAAAASEGEALVIGTAHQLVEVHRIDSVDPSAEVQTPAAILAGHVTPAVHDLAVTPDGRRAATVSADGSVRVWDLETESEIASFLVAGRPTCAIGPNGRFLAINGGGELLVWDLEQFQPRVLRGHRSYVYYCDFAPDGRTLASVGFDQEVRLWDTANGAAAGSIEPGSTERETPWQMVLTQHAWSADGRHLFAAGKAHASLAEIGVDRAYRPLGPQSPAVDDVPSPAWVELCGGPRSTPRFVFAPDGARVVDTQAGELLDVATGNVIHNFEGLWRGSLEPHDASFAASFAPDGARIAITRGDAYVYDVATGARLASISTEGSGSTYGVAWSPDGSRIATGASDGNVRLWDAESLEPIVTLDGHGQYVHDVAWSPDGTQLASASGDGTVRLWDSMPTADRLAASEQTPGPR